MPALYALKQIAMDTDPGMSFDFSAFVICFVIFILIFLIIAILIKLVYQRFFAPPSARQSVGIFTGWPFPERRIVVPEEPKYYSAVLEPAKNAKELRPLSVEQLDPDLMAVHCIALLPFQTLKPNTIPNIALATAFARPPPA